MAEPKIFLAFRFHGNFYHSYRGDTPDEFGFGKDIRIIRHILKVLDAFNARGVPVRGTWDFENYFSLEKIMPEHCPDLISSLQRRVADGLDEIEFMSYNNGLMNAHTAEEFELAMRLARSNPQGSGLEDLFGEKFTKIVRPQEMVYSPAHLRLYPQLGIDTISLYYSGVPFNAFSNFIPLLSPEERYNPLTLSYPGIDQTMTLLPAYNLGDLVDHISLKRWLKSMRRDQLQSKAPKDMLLILDQDADDPIWWGYGAPGFMRKIYPDLFGLEGLVESVKDLPFLEFTTPGAYLERHAPLKTVSFGQDTADGSFDGLASWAEKWSNHPLFTGLERARVMDLQARSLTAGNLEKIKAPLEDLLLKRVKILSTTHFGMAAPVMNLTREKTAARMVANLHESSKALLDSLLPEAEPGVLHLSDYTRGPSALGVHFEAQASRQLLQIPLVNALEATSLQLVENGQPVRAAYIQREGVPYLVFTAGFSPLEHKHFRLSSVMPAPEAASNDLKSSPSGISNGLLRLDLSEDGKLRLWDERSGKLSLTDARTAVNYGGKLCQPQGWQLSSAESLGPITRLERTTQFSISEGHLAAVKQEFILAEGLPYLYFWTKLVLPRTPDKRYDRGKAKRLQQSWDKAWLELMPFELAPAFDMGRELTVWKHDYCSEVTQFKPDYSQFTPNKQLTSFNNQITNGWVALSDGERGLLLAQSADVLANPAFCPMRSLSSEEGLSYRMNPFGTYTGPQYQYALRDTGIGRFLTTRVAPAGQLDPLAPSYNGRSLSFSLLIAPYSGACPGQDLRSDVMAYAYPPLFSGDPEIFALPGHRQWRTEGLGQTPDGLSAEESLRRLAQRGN